MLLFSFALHIYLQALRERFESVRVLLPRLAVQVFTALIWVDDHKIWIGAGTLILAGFGLGDRGKSWMRPLALTVLALCAGLILAGMAGIFMTEGWLPADFRANPR